MELRRKAEAPVDPSQAYRRALVEWFDARMDHVAHPTIESDRRRMRASDMLRLATEEMIKDMMDNG